MSDVKYKFFLLSFLVGLGCESLKPHSIADLDRELMADSQVQAYNLKNEVDRATVGKVLWLKPSKEYDCEYQKPAAAFSEVKVVGTTVEVAQPRLPTFKISILGESGKKQSWVTFIHSEKTWSNEALKNCFYEFDPKKKDQMSQTDWKLIEKGRFRIGFTANQLSLSLGPPEKINRTVSSTMIEEQWVYDNKYFYFRNGKLVSWQD